MIKTSLSFSRYVWQKLSVSSNRRPSQCLLPESDFWQGLHCPSVTHTWRCIITFIIQHPLFFYLHYLLTDVHFNVYPLKAAPDKVFIVPQSRLHEGTYHNFYNSAFFIYQHYQYLLTDVHFNVYPLKAGSFWQDLYCSSVTHTWYYNFYNLTFFIYPHLISFLYIRSFPRFCVPRHVRSWISHYFPTSRSPVSIFLLA